MANPFEDPDGEFLVLVNEEGQYSLWPTVASVPAGWEVARGPGGRELMASFIAEHWSDMRPRSLRDTR